MEIGPIGFGEVGGIFAADLSRGGATRGGACDPLFDGPEGLRRRSAAGTEPAGGLRAACRGVGIVLSAADVAQAASMVLTAGRTLVDLGSTSPSAACEAAGRVMQDGACPVQTPDRRGPMPSRCPPHSRSRSRS